MKDSCGLKFCGIRFSAYRPVVLGFEVDHAARLLQVCLLSQSNCYQTPKTTRNDAPGKERSIFAVTGAWCSHTIEVFVYIKPMTTDPHWLSWIDTRPCIVDQQCWQHLV